MPTSLSQKYKTLQILLPQWQRNTQYFIEDFVTKIELQFHDPIKEHSIEGFPLQLNLSHNLPRYQKLEPLRDSNIGRLTQYIAKKYKKFSAINIGANIGDSVAWMKSQKDMPVLAIEGDDQYYPLLVENMTQFKNVQTEKVFLGEEESVVKVTPYRGIPGSVRLDTDENGQALAISTLDTLLKKKYKKFQKAKFVVIDTDGYDIRIMFGAKDLLTNSQPILFFEYEPECHRVVHENGLRIFPFLKKAGYSQLMIYDNNSDFLLSTNLNNMQLIEELHEYFSGRHGYRYMDIVAFGKEDEDIFKNAVQGERTFFKAHRKF